MSPVSVPAYNNIAHNYGLIETLVIILYNAWVENSFKKNTHWGIFSSCISKALKPLKTGTNSTIFDYIYTQYEITMGQN